MDQIEMMMQKYGDKLQVGYKALRDQYFAYEIISTFMVFAFIFFVTLVLIPVFAPDYGFIKSLIGD